jgi:predicted DNA-binding WGR domain protein
MFIMELFREINLWCNSNRSDKVYNIYLYKGPETQFWTVDVTYGRRGSNLTKLTKCTTSFYYEAYKEFNKLRNAKENKNYTEFGAHVAWAKPKSIKADYYKLYLKTLALDQTFDLATIKRIQSLLESDEESINLGIGVLTTLINKEDGCRISA